MNQSIGSSVAYVIIGGGVAAVSCAREILEVDSSACIIVVSASPVLKVISNRKKVGKLAESFDVEEEEASSVFSGTNIAVMRGKVTHWHHQRKVVVLSDGRKVKYGKLCIATGGRPKEQFVHPLIITVRDVDTLKSLEGKLSGAKRIAVVGNGGIATEIVYELKNIEIIWAIKHSSISAAFFDESGAEFFKPFLLNNSNPTRDKNVSSKRYKVTVDKDGIDTCESTSGCALGPNWMCDLDLSGSLKARSVTVLCNVEMRSIVSEGMSTPVCSQPSDDVWPLFIQLSNGEIIGCDLLIQATGVHPNSDLWKQECDELKLASDGGILVDNFMRTSIDDVYACGDVCTAGWEWSKQWLQMRLWTQAFHMGSYAGRAMALKDVELDFCFEIFTHVTNFFGFRVIFLGRFNGEGLEKPWRLLFRITPGKEYIKLLIKEGRIQGAVLVGETEIEETVEDLIANQLDISSLEDCILDPEIDISDYFD